MKKETLEEVAQIWVHNRFTKQIKDEDIYASESSIVQSHILFAKWQQQSYSEEDMKDYALKCISNYLFGNNFISDNLRIPIVENNNKQFEQFKKK